MVKHCSPKKPVGDNDWHKVDIIAAIWKRHSSLIRLSRQHGYADGSLKLALSMPWPKAERIIAEFIGTPPQEIWPSRYNENGTPNRAPRGNPNWVKGTRRTANGNTSATAAHVKTEGAI
jgi:Ner family transcriptional regulator